jgi:hypothetical protein
VFLGILGHLGKVFCQKYVETLFVYRPFVTKEFNLFVFNASCMKCYRLRDQNRIVFLMGSQVERIEKNYSTERRRLSIDFQMINQNNQSLELLLAEEAYTLFEIRWHRFQTSDEIFFDFAEFQ